MSVTKTNLDSFKGITTYTLKNEYEIYNQNNTKIKMTLEHIKETDAFRIIINLWAKNWMFLRRGNIIFKNDHKTFELPPISENSSVGTENDILTNTKDVKVAETVLYLMKLEDFYSLVQTDNLALRVSGKSFYVDITLKQTVIYYLKAFYHEVIDQKKFGNEFENVLVHDQEENVAKKIGIGLGCVIPLILFLMASYKAFGLDYEKNGWIAGFPFIVAITGAVIYGIRSSQADRKLIKK